MTPVSNVDIERIIKSFTVSVTTQISIKINVKMEAVIIFSTFMKLHYVFTIKSNLLLDNVGINRSKILIITQSENFLLFSDNFNLYLLIE